MNDQEWTTEDPHELAVDDDVLFYLRQGSLMLGKGSLPEARAAFERALDLKPDNPRTRNLLGLTYFRLGLLEAARAIFERLVTENTREASLYVNLGLVLLKQGRLIDAETALKEALFLVPNHKKAHAYLGMVLYRRGDSARARDHFVRGGVESMLGKLDRKKHVPDSDVLSAIAEEGMEFLDRSSETFRPVAASDETGIRDESGWQSGASSDTRNVFPTPKTADSAGNNGEEELETFQSGFQEGTIRGSLEGGSAVPVPEPAPKKSTREVTARPEPRRSIPPEPVKVPLIEPVVDGMSGLAFPDGFSTGTTPGPVARLKLAGWAWIRPSAVSWVAGVVEVSTATRGDLWRIEGDGKVVLRCARGAVVLKAEEDVQVRATGLVGAVGDLDIESSDAGGFLRVLGAGSLLLDGPAQPVLHNVAPGSPLWASDDSLVAFGGRLKTERFALAGASPGFRFSGSGWVLLEAPTRALR